VPDDSDPLIRAVDAIQMPVPDLDAGLGFYRDKLGHELIWCDAHSAGLRMPDSDAELLLVTARPELEPDLVVESAAQAARRWEEAGGEVVVEPEEIAIGSLIVMRDPWGNRPSCSTARRAGWSRTTREA
jgi:catechol 2,3-dioxygenase-like lactoylglutathione lyase family enzyme